MSFSFQWTHVPKFKSNLQRLISLIVLINITAFASYSQADTLTSHPDTVSSGTKKKSKFDRFNKKGEQLFKYIPVPLYAYSSDAGHVFGLAKFNVIDLYKNDSITQPSKISEVVTFSTDGRINVSVATDLMFRDNKYLILSYVELMKGNIGSIVFYLNVS